MAKSLLVISRSFADIVKEKSGKLGDSIWVQLGGQDLRHREEQLEQCLVGRWGKGDGSFPDLDALRTWGIESWYLRGGLQIAKLGGAFLLFEFENKLEADQVLHRGV